MTRLFHLGVSLLVVATVFFSANSAPVMPEAANPDNNSPLSYALLAQNGDSQTFTRLDPRTLADLPGVADTTVEDFYTHIWSEDGSLAIRFERNQRTIVVLDGRTLAEVRRFDAPELVYLTQLSRDGSRLVVAADWYCYEDPCTGTTYYVYDTRGGQLTTSFTGSNRPYFGTLVDRDARTLYAITIDRRASHPGAGGWNRPKTWLPDDESLTYDPTSKGSWPLRITAYDLGTGTERGSVTLTDVQYLQEGIRPVNQVPTARQFRPALALSSDGTRLAAVDATGTTVEVIDTSSMTTETYVVHHGESALTKAARWLGVIPSTAEAKYMDGRFMEARFSADLNFLYFWGMEGWVDPETTEQAGEGFGLTMIDLRTGEITTEILAERFIQNVQLSPDGQNLYLIETPSMPWGTAEQVPSTLRRLDPQTLEPLSERQFTGYVWFMVISAQIKST